MISESEDEAMDCTPPELKEAADRIGESLLPAKSKFRYEKAFQIFEAWCSQKGTRNTASETVLLAYFGELSKEKKPSTLWSTYSMLKTMIKLKEKVDISNYAKLIAFLKRQNLGFQPKKSSVFSRENINEFLTKAAEEFISIKVALIVGVSGACRSDELVKMKMEHVNVLEGKIVIEIPHTKTYTSRSFIISDPDWVAIFHKYLTLRKNLKNDRLFVQWRNGKLHNQAIGYHSISKFPHKIAAFLKLPKIESFTGHAFRRTSATLLVDNGADLLQLKRLGGWKSSTVAEGYIEASLENKSKTALMLSSTSKGIQSSSASTSTSHTETHPQAQEIIVPNETQFQQDGLKISIINNNANLTINVNK